MDIIHVDPGYGKGVTTNGTLTTVESEEYNPINGVAFTGNNCNITFPIPDFFYNANKMTGKELWRIISLRFSVYLDLQDSDTFIVGFKSPLYEMPTFGISFTSNSWKVNPISVSTDNPTISSGVSATGLHNVAISSCLGRTKYGTSSSTEVLMRTFFDIDGTTTSTGATYTQITMPSEICFMFPENQTDTCYVSNIIVATLHEFYQSSIAGEWHEPSPLLTSSMLPVRLPLSTPPTGDFLSVGDGEYVGNTSGQKLLQTINASDVIAKYGASIKVSHLVVYGAPGYRVGSNVTTAYGISESDGTVTQHGSTALSTDTDATACVAWEADSGTTLSDIDGLKIGWQV